MEISTLSGQEIFEVATPVWERMAEGSNKVDFALFSSQFSDELIERMGKEKFEKQCQTYPLLTSLGKSKPIACIRRDEGVTVLFRLLSTKLEGEFVGQLRLSGTTKDIKVTDAQVY